jgi:hypothetical protein
MRVIIFQIHCMPGMHIFSLVFEIFDNIIKYRSNASDREYFTSVNISIKCVGFGE